MKLMCPYLNARQEAYPVRRTVNDAQHHSPQLGPPWDALVTACGTVTRWCRAW